MKKNNKQLLRVLSDLVFAGDLLKLSEHPKYRKDMEKRKIKEKNEEILRREKSGSMREYTPKTPYEKKIHDKVNKVNEIQPAKKISDEDLEEFVEQYRDTDNEFDSFNIMLDRGLIDLAASYLKDAGVLDPDNSSELDVCRSICKRLETYSPKRDSKELLKDIEVWVSTDTGETCFVPSDDVSSEFDCGTLDGFEFDCGYDENGKRYSVSILDEISAG